jgi:cytochrome c oxidase cbb3-type subunit 3
MKSEEPKRDELLNEPLREHSFDGIHEFDNRLPNWWLGTLYIMILISIIYWFSWFSTHIAKSDAARLEENMAELEAKRLAAAGDISEETLWKMSQNVNFVNQGKVVFEANCAQCHLSNLRGKEEGGIGESLADSAWLYGNTAMYVYHIAQKGSPNIQSGMVSWESQLGPQRISEVVAYILSHHDQGTMTQDPVKYPEIIF